MSVMALDDVSPFLHLKIVTNTCKRMPDSPTIGEISSVQYQKLEENEDFKCVSLFILCLNRNRSALAVNWFSYNSDKSLALHYN